MGTDKNFSAEDIAAGLINLVSAAANGVTTGAVIVKDKTSKTVQKLKAKPVVTQSVRVCKAVTTKKGEYEKTELFDLNKISEFIAKTPDGNYKIIVKNPNVVIFWEDGTTTSVRCSANDTFDVEKGVTMAILKKLFGKNYYRNIAKVISKAEEVDATPFVRKKAADSAEAGTEASKAEAPKAKKTRKSTKSTKKA